MKGLKEGTATRDSTECANIEKRVNEIEELLLSPDEVNWQSIVRSGELEVGEHWFILSGGLSASVHVFSKPHAPFDFEDRDPKSRTYVSLFDSRGSQFQSFSDIPETKSVSLNLLASRLKSYQKGLGIKHRPSWVKATNSIPTQDFVDRELYNVMQFLSRKASDVIKDQPK